jgi:hypothetical protein
MSILIIIANIFANNPIAAPRYWVGTIAVALVFVLAPIRSARRAFVFVALFCVLFLIIFPVADVFRLEVPSDWLGTATQNVGISNLLTKTDFDSFQQTNNSVLYVERESVQQGRQVLGALLFWVPRTLWPDKPEPSGEVIANFIGFPNTNLSFPLWAELYIDFHLVGVTLGFLLFGAISGLLDKASLRYSESATPGLWPVAVPVFAAYQIFFLRGSLMATMAYLTPLVACLFVVAKRARASSEEDGIQG